MSAENPHRNGEINAVLQRVDAIAASAAAGLSDDPNVIQELRQDTLIRMWRTASALPLDDPRGFTSRIRRTTFNLAIDHRRAQEAGLPQTELTDDVANGVVGGAIVPGFEEAAVNSTVLTGAVRGLSSEQRTLLGVVYWQGHTLTDAAEVLNVPKGTVKSRLNAALGNLRGKLHGGGLER